MGNSRDKDFDALVGIVGYKGASWPVASLAGRGISAYARAQIWVVDSGKKNVDPYVLGDMLIDFAEQMEKVAPLMQRFHEGELDAPGLASELKPVVLALEKWAAEAEARPRRWR